MQPPIPQEGIALELLFGIVVGLLLILLVSPRSQVLIIGGGDGGVLREVVKSSLVESVVLCEIDEVGATTLTRILCFSLAGGRVHAFYCDFRIVSVVMLSSVQEVINASKKFLPGMASGFYSPKLILHIGDGFEFMKKNQDAFDIIITDSSDPVGKRCFGSVSTPSFANPYRRESISEF